jgi:hypothetical protein
MSYWKQFDSFTGYQTRFQPRYEHAMFSPVGIRCVMGWGENPYTLQMHVQNSPLFHKGCTGNSICHLSGYIASASIVE